MRLVLHQRIPDDPVLAQQWNELASQTEQPQVFHTYEWSLAVDRAYHASLRPLLILAYDQDVLVGLAAMATDLAAKRASFLTATTADYCDFISHPSRREELVENVMRELRQQGVSTLVLANLPADSATVSVLQRTGRKCGYRTFGRPAYLCARIVLGEGEDRKRLRETVTNRKRLRYYLRGLEKLGPVRIEHMKSWECIQSALPAFFEAHIARFATTGRISNLAKAERQGFLHELAQLLSRHGWVVLSRLVAAQEAIAWNYGFQFGGSWFWYQPTFLTSLQDMSPGFCLLSKTVEAGCDTPDINLIDLGLGAEGYKERFANGARQTLHVTATTSRTEYVREIVRYRAASAIKRYPRMDRWARVLLGRPPAEEHGKVTPS